MTSTLRRAAVPVLAVSLPIIAILAALEGVSRLILPAYLPPHPRGLYLSDPDLGYRYAPNFKGRINWWRRHPIRVRTNSLGLRDRDYGTKAPNVTRVLMLGDSQTFGMVEEDASLPRLLEKELNEAGEGGRGGGGARDTGIRYEMINARHGRTEQEPIPASAR
jgi:hypothetical protein